MKVSDNLPQYDGTEEWHTTLLELQAHLTQRRERRQNTDDSRQSRKEDEMQEALMQVTLRKLGVIVSMPDAKIILNDWADVLLCGSEEQKDLVIAGLEKCLPLLLGAPIQYVRNIIAAAAASISGEGGSNEEVDVDFEHAVLHPPLPEPPTELSAAPRTMSPGTSTETIQANFNESAWTAALQQLQKKVHAARKGKKKGEFSSSVSEVVDSMVKLAALHPDPAVKNELLEQAKRLGTAKEQERKQILNVLGKGMGLILIAPVALAGVAVFAVGTLVYGSGKVIMSMGQVLTLGKLRSLK